MTIIKIILLLGLAAYVACGGGEVPPTIDGITLKFPDDDDNGTHFTRAGEPSLPLNEDKPINIDEVYYDPVNDDYMVYVNDSGINGVQINDAGGMHNSNNADELTVEFSDDDDNGMGEQSKPANFIMPISEDKPKNYIINISAESTVVFSDDDDNGSKPTNEIIPTSEDSDDEFFDTVEEPDSSGDEDVQDNDTEILNEDGPIFGVDTVEVYDSVTVYNNSGFKGVMVNDNGGTQVFNQGNGRVNYY